MHTTGIIINYYYGYVYLLLAIISIYHCQDCRQQKQTLGVLQREVDSLRGDNVKLFEKIRFLQSYPGTVRQLDAIYRSYYYFCGLSFSAWMLTQYVCKSHQYNTEVYPINCLFSVSLWTVVKL